MKDDVADVLIVGAGPTGLTLGATLAARGMRTIVVDRLTAGANTTRAGVVHARTLEVLETIGVAERLVQLGLRVERFTIRDRDRLLVPVQFERLPTRYPYLLMISQAVTESVLRERFTQLGGQVRWGTTVTDVIQDAEGVSASLQDGTRLRARYLVGADGTHSTVRERAGIAFPGGSYGESFSLADVRLSGGASKDEVILYFSADGLVVVAPLPGGIHRVVAVADSAPEHPDAAFVQTLLDSRGPQQERALVEEVLWGSRFRLHHRVAEAYRTGRILLVGDAAHVHSPAGGQGMNTGIQDAMVLADALARAIAARDGSALDIYETLRRPVAKQVVAFTDRLTRMATAGPRLRAMRNALLRLLARIPAFRKRLAWRLSGLVYRPQ